MAGVVKLAQPGYDVKTAGDENLIYSSLWPLLKIYKQGGFTVSDVTQEVTIAEHDLPFTPMYMYFSNATLASWQGTGSVVNEDRSEFFGPVGDGNIVVTDSALKFKPGSMTGSLKGYYYIYALSLTERFTAPITRVGDIGGGGGSKGVFKIAKPGKDIHSHNLEDYVIHSRARSPLVHSVSPGTVQSGEFVAFHNLRYNPMFFGYTKNSDGSYQLLPTGLGGSNSFSTDESKVRFTENTNGRELSIVILKDPFNLERSVSVTI